VPKDEGYTIAMEDKRGLDIEFSSILTFKLLEVHNIKEIRDNKISY
jgi:hypothetical protein